LESETGISLELLVAIGTAGMLILVVSIILFVALYQKKVLAQQNEIQLAENRHQRELLNATIEVAEQEREKIAKNIHDDVGTQLNVIRLHMTKLSRNAGDKVLSEEIAKESISMVDESIKTVRGIAHDLMPPTLVKLGLDKGLEELCRQLKHADSLKVELSLATNGVRLAPPVELQLYRAIREVINNIIKHSQASLIRITLRANPELLTAVIGHDGVGITNEAVNELMQAQKGVGLKSIQSRVQLVKGSIQYLSKGDRDSEIIIEVPV
jgi:signal transduction histidine kinase